MIEYNTYQYPNGFTRHVFECHDCGLIWSVEEVEGYIPHCLWCGHEDATPNLKVEKMIEHNVNQILGGIEHIFECQGCGFEWTVHSDDINGYAPYCIECEAEDATANPHFLSLPKLGDMTFEEAAVLSIVGKHFVNICENLSDDTTVEEVILLVDKLDKLHIAAKKKLEGIKMC